MAAVTSVTTKFIGTRAMAFEADCGGVADTITNAQLLTVAPAAGALRTFLTGNYADAPAAETAFLALGGILSVRTRAGTTIITDAGWSAAGANSLLIQLAVGAADSFAEVTIILPHSIMQ